MAKKQTSKMAFTSMSGPRPTQLPKKATVTKKTVTPAKKTVAKATPKKVTKTVTKSTPTKQVAKKPIQLPEVRVTAQRDSVDLGQGSSRKRYAVSDVRDQVKNNPGLYPNKTVDTTNSRTISQSTSRKDSENQIASGINAKKKAELNKKTSSISKR